MSSNNKSATKSINRKIFPDKALFLFIYSMDEILIEIEISLQAPGITILHDYIKNLQSVQMAMEEDSLSLETCSSFL